MKLLYSLAAGKNALSLSTRKLSFAVLMAALSLAASAAKADVVKTFDLTGVFQFPTPERTFSGTLIFDFTRDAVDSVDISVDGLSAYNQNPSLHFAGKEAIVDAFDSDGDMLTFMFALSQGGTLTGFSEGKIVGGDAPFSNRTGVLGVLINATGSIVLDPPPDLGPAAVPELPTWAMMLLGLAGLGLAAKARRGFGVLVRA